MCERLQAVKGFSHVAASVGAAMCSAFSCGSRKAAGHNAFRGSGPGQKLAFDNAVAHVGCPDRRIDQFCITCCLPLPTVHLRRSLARTRLYCRRRLPRKRDRLLVTLALGHHRPGHPGELIGKRYRRILCWPPLHQRCQPRPMLGAMHFRIFYDCQRADAEERSQIPIPAFVMLPSLSRPPLEFCLGTSPIQAAKSRPERKAFGSATLATSAVASAGPTPGMASSRLLSSFDRCHSTSRRSRMRICSLRA